MHKTVRLGTVYCEPIRKHTFKYKIRYLYRENILELNLELVIQISETAQRHGGDGVSIYTHVTPYISIKLYHSRPRSIRTRCSRNWTTAGAAPARALGSGGAVRGKRFINNLFQTQLRRVSQRLRDGPAGASRLTVEFRDLRGSGGHSRSRPFLGRNDRGRPPQNKYFKFTI